VLAVDDIKALVNGLRKEFGEDSFYVFGDDESRCSVPKRSSGSILLDIALGGGFGKGRVTCLAGMEKSGKSSILYMTIAEAQKQEPEKSCAIIDLEYTFSPDWAKKLGVDMNNLIFSQPDRPAEGVYDMIEAMLKSGKFSVIGLDSLAGLVPKEEFENEDWSKESRVGGASKINSKAVRKLVNTGILTESGTSLIIINQLRDLIGGFSPYGTPTTTTGGRSLKHAYTTQVDVSIGDYFTVGNGKERTFLGQQIVAKVSKNKLGPPHRKAVIDVYYDHGIDRTMELVIAARLLGVLKAGGAWLTAVDPRTGEVLTFEDKDIKFNGKDKARDALDEDIAKTGGAIYSMIYELVIDVMNGKGIVNG
jgi:recombination protein RecA